MIGSAPGFNEYLHALRGAELRRMPRGARTFLSAGCSGSWYFRWIAENYTGIDRHIGIEAYNPKPDDLPPEVVWLANSVGDMREVESGTIDLLFSGQNIEHLAQPDIACFLCEAKRVLRSGGGLVIDSPNRAMTEALKWIQPEHVIEFRVDEIAELVRLAGFEIESIRGLWQCYDPSSHRLLPLDPSDDVAANERRVDAARDDPENAFVWWLTARRIDRKPDRSAIDAKVAAVAAQAFPRLAKQFFSQLGTITHGALMAEARAERGSEGFLLYGPYTPLFPGRYHALFRLRVDGTTEDASTIGDSHAARIDVFTAMRNVELAARDIDGRELAVPGPDGYCAFGLTFNLATTAFGVEFRVFTTGAVPLAAAVPVQLARIG